MLLAKRRKAEAKYINGAAETDVKTQLKYLSILPCNTMYVHMYVYLYICAFSRNLHWRGNVGCGYTEIRAKGRDSTGGRIRGKDWRKTINDKEVLLIGRTSGKVVVDATASTAGSKGCFIGINRI